MERLRNTTSAGMPLGLYLACLALTLGCMYAGVIPEKMIPALLVLMFGHLLNLALAGLAVLVHAVRLNTLEFSTHKGLTWSGYGFNPFRKNSQNKE